MTIATILAGRDWETITVEVGTPVSAVVGLLAEKRIGAVPVIDGGRVVGIFSERDAIYHLKALGAAMLDQPVEKAMTAPAISVPPDTLILTALAMMTKRRIRHLPVMKDDVMVGFVSIGDLVKKRIEGIEQEAEAMREYIQTA